MAGQGLQALGADPKAGSAVSGIADMASQYIKLKADDKDPTTVSKQDALAAGLSGAASGAKMGAQMGSMLGPAGTAVERSVPQDLPHGKLVGSRAQCCRRLRHCHCESGRPSQSRWAPKGRRHPEGLSLDLVL